jgi:hypothetical protein
LSGDDDWLMWRLRTSNHQTRLTDFAVTRRATPMPMVFDNAGILTEDERNFVQPQSRLVDGISAINKRRWMWRHAAPEPRVVQRSLRSGRSRASAARLGEITDDRRTWPDRDVQGLEIGITTYGERGAR